MRHSLLLLLLIVLTLSIRVNAAEERDNESTKLNAVEKYLLQDEYPELFGDSPYKLRPTEYAIGDLDGDGVDEVVMSFYPHYRQSPTILLFRVSDDLKVVKVKEGLAPGPLLEITGEYLDSHNIGMAVDMSVGEKEMQDAERRRTFVLAALEHGQHIVGYEKFFHLDGREGSGSYIDMTHVKNMPGADTCKNFQFSRVEHIELVKEAEGKKSKLMVDVGGVRYEYTINKFLPDGLIDKSVRVSKRQVSGGK